MPTIATNGRELTDADFWDGVWSKQNTHPGFKTHHYKPFLYGQNGLYTRMMRHRLGPLAGARVLEFGAGGPNLRLLAMRKFLGAEVTAIDFSPAALMQLKELFDFHGETLVDVILDDFLTHDFGQARFDLIVHWGVAEHFTDLVPFFSRCQQLLTTEGEMLFGMPNMEGWAAKSWKRWSPQNWSKHQLHTSDQIRIACQEVGLDVQSEFHFGPPFIGYEVFEDKSRAANCVALLQRVLAKIPMALPMFHRVGTRAWSMERGFHVNQGSSPRADVRVPTRTRRRQPAH